MGGSCFIFVRFCGGSLFVSIVFLGSVFISGSRLFRSFFFVLVVSRLGRLGAWFSLRFGLVWIRYFRFFGFGMFVGSVFVLSRSVVWIDSVISAVRCVVSVSFFRLLDFV